jgi:hypothetical protein
MNFRETVEKGTSLSLLWRKSARLSRFDRAGEILTQEKAWRNDQSMSKVTGWIVLACATSAEGFCSWRFLVLGFAEGGRDLGAANECNPCLGL